MEPIGRRRDARVRFVTMANEAYLPGLGALLQSLVEHMIHEWAPLVATTHRARMAPVAMPSTIWS